MLRLESLIFKRLARLLMVALICAVALAAADPATARPKKQHGGVPATGQSIEWGERITLVPPRGVGRYPRLLKIGTGDHAGDLLLCYETGLYGGHFWMYRSTDGGHDWGKPRLIQSADESWIYASCNMTQLQDGRLMMTMLRRGQDSPLARDQYIDIRFSQDGGETWGPQQQVFQGANWEARPIEVPHDGNGDGIRDIYIFFTQRAVPTTVPVEQARRQEDFGRAVAWIVSRDGGRSWDDPNPERFTARLVHRNYIEERGMAPSWQSGGGMPTPFILPGPRIAFVAEAPHRQQAPHFVASDPGDWDWTGPAFQGPWTSADYNGLADNSIYPLTPQNAWPMTQQERGNAPYAAVLPDGRVIVSLNTKARVNVWLGNDMARDFEKQEPPFGNDKAVFSFIEPISETEVLVGAGPDDPGRGYIYLRRGRIVD